MQCNLRQLEARARFVTDSTGMYDKRAIVEVSYTLTTDKLTAYQTCGHNFWLHSPDDARQFVDGLTGRGSGCVSYVDGYVYTTPGTHGIRVVEAPSGSRAVDHSIVYPSARIADAIIRALGRLRVGVCEDTTQTLDDEECYTTRWLLRPRVHVDFGHNNTLSSFGAACAISPDTRRSLVRCLHNEARGARHDSNGDVVTLHIAEDFYRDDCKAWAFYVWTDNDARIGAYRAGNAPAPFFSNGGFIPALNGDGVVVYSAHH